MKKINLTQAEPYNSIKQVVLIVEDNKDWQDIISHEVEEAGCLSVRAASFEQALKLATERKFDLISLDIDLKDDTMLGRMFMQLIPDINKETPILIVTGVLNPTQEEVLDLTNHSKVQYFFFKQGLILSEFKTTIKKILKEQDSKQNPNNQARNNTIISDPNLKKGQRPKNSFLQVEGKNKFYAKKLMISTLLGLMVYGSITLPYFWFAQILSIEVSITHVIVGNLISATITLIYILSVYGAINKKQTVSIILALVSTVSAVKLLSPEGGQNIIELILDKKDTLFDWFLRLFTRAEENQ